jgi:hypothetical protein
MLLNLQHFGGRRVCSNSGMRLGQVKSGWILHMNLHKPNKNLVMHSYNTFEARMSHGTQTHKTHHNLDLGEATTFPLIIFFVSRHMGYIQMSFCPRTPKLGVPKFSKLGLPRFWRPITFCSHLQLRWGLRQSCSPHRELSKYMWHATCTQVNQGGSWLLMVNSQIDTLIFSPSFDHNLCFMHSNGTCEPI